MSDDEDELIALQLLSEDGKPLGFRTLGDAADALEHYLDTDGTIEVHDEGCDGVKGIDCDCGVEVFTASELFPKVQA